jgi:hypothetical protein
VRPRISTRADRPDLWARLDELPDVWPEFIHHANTTNRLWHLLHERHPELQLVLYDEDTETVLGRGQTMPVVWDGTVAGLPGGVDDVLLRAEAGDGPATTLSAMVATVDPRRQGEGLSGHIIRGMADAAGRAGLDALIAPVRPTWKQRYPLTPIERYVEWRRDDGLLYDPWLRLHERLGARILGIAEASMTVEGTVAEWEAWTGLVFPDSGDYVVEGALVPVTIDREADRGLYVEPNVWMRHEVPPG